MRDRPNRRRCRHEIYAEINAEINAEVERAWREHSYLGGVQACYAKYGAYPVKAKYCHESALRIVLGCIEGHANRRET